MSLNRVTLIGHLGQDPELRHLPTSGQPVASFSIATDEAYTDRQGHRQERVDWHNIVVLGKVAESCKEYLKKGRRDARSTLKAGCGYASTRPRTTAASASAPRLSQPAYSFSARGQPMRREPPRSRSRCRQWTQRFLSKASMKTLGQLLVERRKARGLDQKRMAALITLKEGWSTARPCFSTSTGCFVDSRNMWFQVINAAALDLGFPAISVTI